MARLTELSFITGLHDKCRPSYPPRGPAMLGTIHTNGLDRSEIDLSPNDLNVNAQMRTEIDPRSI